MIIDWNNRDEVNKLLNLIADMKASDLHLRTGQPAVVRVSGRLRYLTEYPDKWHKSDIENILNTTFKSTAGSVNILSKKDIDFAYHPSPVTTLDAVRLKAGFRVNACADQAGFMMVFRRLDPMPPKPADIMLPDDFINALTSYSAGIILVTGATGSGKSTTLASGIRHLKENIGGYHILTLEDPIEYIYRDIPNREGYVTVITQRELQTNMASFQVGLKSSLRQDPDVVFVGELRDKETIQLALTVAETGHLVLATVHSSSVASTISRIVQSYPSSEQDSARALLINALRFVMTQQLITKKEGGRLAIRERLDFDPAFRKTLLNSVPSQIPQLIDVACEENGTKMEQQLANVYKDGLIDEVELKVRLAEMQIDFAETMLNSSEEQDVPSAVNLLDPVAKPKLFDED